MSWNAHVWVKCSNDFSPQSNWEWLKEWKNVHRAWWTMGDWDLCLEVSVNTPEELENFVWSQLRKKEWVSNTHSTWTKEVWSNGVA